MNSNNSTRVSFADLLKKGAEKDQQKITDKPKLAVVETKNEPTTPTSATPATPPTEATPRTPSTSKVPVAPEKDYAKVANSIVRDAVAGGLFIGKSKQIYDSLYLKTRGAMQPTRSIRTTKLNLMRASDIGSERTLLKNLSHLKSIGLVKITEYDGQHEGNEYEVILPEEIVETHPTPPTARQPHYPLQKVGTVPPVESGVGGVAQIQENKDTYGSAKTSFKDINTNDDERSAFALFSGFVEKFQTAAKKLTGAPLSKYEREKWEHLADLLVLELETASRHASNPVSSVPAFLTKVLSSRLLNQKQHERTSKSNSGTKPDTVGKYYPELDDSDEEIKPLNEESKEAAVDFLREFKDDEEFLDGYKKWYTEEDWNWIIKELEINK